MDFLLATLTAKGHSANQHGRIGHRSETTSAEGLKAAAARAIHQGGGRHWMRSGRPKDTRQTANRAQVLQRGRRFQWAQINRGAGGPGPPRSMPMLYRVKTVEGHVYAQRQKGDGPENCPAGSSPRQSAGRGFLVVGSGSHHWGKAFSAKNVTGKCGSPNLEPGRKPALGRGRTRDGGGRQKDRGRASRSLNTASTTHRHQRRDSLRLSKRPRHRGDRVPQMRFAAAAGGQYFIPRGIIGAAGGGARAAGSTSDAHQSSSSTAVAQGSTWA